MTSAPQSADAVATNTLAAVTGWVSCRLDDDHALLDCKRCGVGRRVAAAPRAQFLLAVRTFIRCHEHRAA